ncbi:MAG: trypsin-like peptidase domain-containing protein [Pirellulaceae bacterium]
MSMRTYYSLLLAVVGCVTFEQLSRAADPVKLDSLVVEAQQQRVDVMRRAASATISIFGLDGGGGGSGVIVTPDGYALTNYHVSSACGDHMRCGLDDGSLVDAVIVGIDATGDVSLIKLLGRDDFPTAPLADSDEVRVGQWCFAAGNPFVLATNLQPSISLGIVSGVNRYQYPAGTLLEYADCIQTDAAVNPGNSGGPLFDLSGQVIGINGRCSFEKRGRVNVGVGYAISANQIKYFMDILRSGRLVDHATLGATVSTDEAAEVLVSNILNGSDAYRRGLRYGDEIVRLADREVKTTNTFKNILGTLPKDWRVPIEIRRNGETQTLLVRLDGVHTEKQLIDAVAAGLGGAPPKPPEGHGQEGGPEQDDSEQDDSEKDDPERDGSDAPLKEGGEKEQAAEGLEGQPDKKLVASMLEARAGFANYYFNRLKREELSGQLQSLGDFTAAGGRWTMSGLLAGETTEVAMDLDVKSASLSVGQRATAIDLDKPLSDIVAARGEGGLLLAMRALQELLRTGPEKMGASTYLGRFPVYASTSTKLREQPRHDVLQTLWYDAQVRFSIDPKTGAPSLIEVFGDVGQDPVEVYLADYQTFRLGDQEMQFPSRLRLQYGMEPMMLIDLKSVSFDSTSRPSGEATE